MTSVPPTSAIPDPTVGVPPDDVPTVIVTGENGQPTPTKDVDTFVQGYTGDAARRVERVWWVVGVVGAVVGVGASVW
jgi:hypothetical protein